MRFLGALLVMSMLWPTQNIAEAQGTGAGAPGQAQLERMAARFAPTPLRVDISPLSPSDRQALAKLVEAARLIDVVFMKQLWSGDVALYERLKKDTTPLGRARLHYFW